MNRSESLFPKRIIVFRQRELIIRIDQLPRRAEACPATEGSVEGASVRRCPELACTRSLRVEGK